MRVYGIEREKRDRQREKRETEGEMKGEKGENMRRRVT